MSTLERINENWVIRAEVVAMFVVLGLLAGLSLATQRRITSRSARSSATTRARSSNPEVVAALCRVLDRGALQVGAEPALAAA